MSDNSISAGTDNNKRGGGVQLGGGGDQGGEEGVGEGGEEGVETDICESDFRGVHVGSEYEWELGEGGGSVRVDKAGEGCVRRW